MIIHIPKMCIRDSHKGAERGVILYSLACSCRMHGINTFEYIADVINKAAKLPPNTDRKDVYKRQRLFYVVSGL